jgi:hypothetical protein
MQKRMAGAEGSNWEEELQRLVRTRKGGWWQLPKDLPEEPRS